MRTRPSSGSAHRLRCLTPEPPATAETLTSSLINPKDTRNEGVVSSARRGRKSASVKAELRPFGLTNANGTVNPSDRPITISRTISGLINVRSSSPFRSLQQTELWSTKRIEEESARPLGLECGARGREGSRETYPGPASHLDARSSPEAEAVRRISCRDGEGEDDRTGPVARGRRKGERELTVKGQLSPPPPVAHTAALKRYMREGDLLEV